MLVAEQRHQRVERFVEFAAILGRPRDDERRARFVDQDRVDFVDNREAVAALNHLAQRVLHVVAQIVEAELVVGPVSDVGGVSLTALVVVEPVHNGADGKAEEAIDLPHPLGVALGEIVVDGNDVDAAALKRVQVNRRGGDERLAFAGAHFGDLALVQKDAAHELHVIMALTERTLGRFAHGRESLWEDIVQLGAARQLVAVFARLVPERLVRESFKGRLKRIDARHERPQLADLAVINGAENLLGEVQHVRILNVDAPFFTGRGKIGREPCACWLFCVPPTRARVCKHSGLVRWRDLRAALGGVNATQEKRSWAQGLHTRRSREQNAWRPPRSFCPPPA